MLSRVAEDLYWFGRYVQRAENTARLIEVQTDLLLDLPRNAEFSWSVLIQILGVSEVFEAKHGLDYTETNVVRFMIAEPENPSSIVGSLKSAREILRTVREAMPRDVWEHLNDVYLLVLERGEKMLGRTKRLELMRKVEDSMLLVSGLLYACMSHDVGFHFLRIGNALEQVDMTTRIVDVRTSGLIRPAAADEQLRPFQNIQWMSVLNSLDAYQMYRRHERSRVRSAAVLSFLSQDREFPRSLMFCLNMISRTLPQLPPNRTVERVLNRTRGLVQDANLEKLVENGLHDWIDEIQVDIGKLHDAIDASYFTS